MTKTLVAADDRDRQPILAKIARLLRAAGSLKRAA